MKRAWAMLKRLHSDETGADMLEKLLIIAAVVLPLLGLLIVFRDAVGTWAKGMWNQIAGDAGNPIPGSGGVDIPTP